MFPRTANLPAALILCAALLPAALLAWRWRAMPQFGVFHDDAIYTVAAKSIAQQGSYRISSLPGEPYQTKYPPLYPLLLSLAWLVEPSFPATLPWILLVTWMALPASVFLILRLLLDSGFSQPDSAGIAAWTALNPVAVMFALLAMSEMWTLALLTGAMILLERASRRQSPDSIALLAGLAAGLAFLARSAALPLAASAPAVFLALRLPRRAGLFLAGMLPLVLGWQSWAAASRMPSSDFAAQFYTDYLGFYLADFSLQTLPGMAWLNFGAAVKAIGELLVFDEDITLFTLTLARLLSVAATAGAIRLARRGVLRHYAMFSLLYVVQCLVWNYPPNSRFLLPLLPMLAAGAWTEASHLASVVAGAFRKRKAGDRAVAVFVAALLAALALYAANRILNGLVSTLPSVMAAQQQRNDQAAPAWRWLAGNAPRTANVLAYADPVVYLRTGLHAISLRVPPSAMYRNDRAAVGRYFSRLPELLRLHKVHYVLATPGDYHFDAPHMTVPDWRAALGGLDPVFRSGDVAVYRTAEPLQ